MNDSSRYCKNSKYFLLIFSFVLISISVVSCSQGPKPAQFPTELIWPPPPDMPRVKFISVLRSEEDLSGQKKRGLKDILLGTDPRQNVRRLRKPYGICTDSKGRIYVADSGLGVVFVFDRTTKAVTYLGDKGPGKLSWPLDVEVDRADRIYVSDVNLKNVNIFSSDGSFISNLAIKGNFTNPAGLAIDQERNRILIVDSKAHKVYAYTLDGEFITEFGERGTEEGQFNFPTNIAVGKDGYVYVVDTMNHRVQVFDTDYEYFDDFGSLGVHPGQFRRPKGIALDSENHIYVIDSDFNNFQIFDQDYNILMPVGKIGQEPGQFWLPAGIHIDANDMIYVADSTNQRIQIFQYLKQR